MQSSRSNYSRAASSYIGNTCLALVCCPPRPASQIYRPQIQRSRIYVAGCIFATIPSYCDDDMDSTSSVIGLESGVPVCLRANPFDISRQKWKTPWISNGISFPFRLLASRLIRSIYNVPFRSPRKQLASTSSSLSMQVGVTELPHTNVECHSKARYGRRSQ